MQKSTLIELENLFLALSDKTRLRLLTLMADGEVSVGYLADTLGESQPKISRHLAYLRGSGLVSTRRDGKWVYYGIEQQMDPAVGRVLNATFDMSPAMEAVQTPERSYRNDGDAYRSYDDEGNLSDQPYADDWAPAEIDIFLL